MPNPQDTLDKLIAFKDTHKLSDEVWQERGVNPSETEISKSIDMLLRNCTDNLITAVNRRAPKWTLRSVLKKGMSSFNRLDYDAEEAEFIGDLMFELAEIVNINFAFYLNRWMYGASIAISLEISSLLKDKTVKQTLVHPCIKCTKPLETFILKKEKGIKELGWYLVKCNACGEYNLLPIGPNIKRLKFGNYLWVETFNKDDYTYEQALNRLEQIKFFRK